MVSYSVIESQLDFVRLSLYLNLDKTFLARMLKISVDHLSKHPLRKAPDVHIALTTSANMDPVVKVPASFLHHKVTVSPTIVNEYLVERYFKTMQISCLPSPPTSFSVLAIELRILCTLGKHSTTEIYPKPLFSFCFICWLVCLSIWLWQDLPNVAQDDLAPTMSPGWFHSHSSLASALIAGNYWCASPHPDAFFAVVLFWIIF